LKESGEIEQDASIVGFLHRSEYYGVDFDDDGQPTTGKGEFLIAKNREGVTGVIDMDVDLTTSTWTDPQPTWNQPTEPKPEYVQKPLNGFENSDENPF
jgi:replicative DNA helicase